MEGKLEDIFRTKLVIKATEVREGDFLEGDHEVSIAEVIDVQIQPDVVLVNLAVKGVVRLDPTWDVTVLREEERPRKFRIVEHRYDNYIVHEDGDALGLSDFATNGPYKTLVWEGVANLEDFDNPVFLEGEGIEFKQDSEDGFTELYYRFEELIDGKWELVKERNNPA